MDISGSVVNSIRHENTDIIRLRNEDELRLAQMGMFDVVLVLSRW